MIIPDSIFKGYYDASAGTYPSVPSQDSFWIISTAGTINGLTYKPNDVIIYQVGIGFYPNLGLSNWGAISDAPETATRFPRFSEVTDVPDTLVFRDSNGDAEARMWKSTYPSQSEIPLGSSLAFRVNSTDDNYLRTASREAVLDYLGTVKDSTLLQGKTLDTIKAETRRGLALDTTTINKKPLSGPIELTAADIGLGLVPNYAATNSSGGTSTSLLATQKAANEAASAPRLDIKRKRIIDISEQAPTANSEDGLYIQLDKASKTFKLVVKHENIIYTT